MEMIKQLFFDLNTDEILEIEVPEGEIIEDVGGWHRQLMKYDPERFPWMDQNYKKNDATKTLDLQEKYPRPRALNQ